MDNNAIAEWLRQHARERDAEGGNLMRVRAYRRAAHLIQEMDEPLEKVFERAGRHGIRALPGVGRRIASAIKGLLQAGKPSGVSCRVMQR